MRRLKTLGGMVEVRRVMKRGKEGGRGVVAGIYEIYGV
jgi:hypothetical protein